MLRPSDLEEELITRIFKDGRILPLFSSWARFSRPLLLDGIIKGNPGVSGYSSGSDVHQRASRHEEGGSGSGAHMKHQL